MESKLQGIPEYQKAISDADTIPEIKRVRDEIDAVIPVLKQLRREGRMKFEEIFPLLVSKLDAERKAGGMLAEIERTEANQYTASLQCNEATYTQILEESEINHETARRWQTEAELPDNLYLKYLDEIKVQEVEPTSAGLREKAMRYRGNIAQKWTGNQENYTPAVYIEAARSVMGSIDLDPASCELAQQTVKANKFYTKEDDGLNQGWGGNIFLNPPYSHPDVANFVNKLLSELKDGQQAILLTNNNTDTGFFHKAAERASALCFTKGRIKFYKADGETTTEPTNGQVFYYFGKNTSKFIEMFSQFGLLMAKL